jgi:hypothetical protein
MMTETKYTFDEDILSDLYKDAHGFRPREDFWSGWALSTADKKQQIWDSLIAMADFEAARELEEQLAAEASVEGRIESIMQTVRGCTREDAIRYLHDAYNTRGDRQFLEYCLGVRYGYLDGSLTFKVGY